MDNNSSTWNYLFEFYGSPSATWFAIYVWIAAFFVIFSDTFIIVLTLTSTSLRNNEANWFLLGYSLSDMLHCVAHVLDSYAIWYSDRHACYISGLFVVFTGVVSFGFPALIAADRYYKISDLPQYKSVGWIGKKVFAKKAALPLIIGWYALVFMINLPLLLNQAFGEDPAGFCGARKFTLVTIMMSYELSVITVYVISMSATAIYYYRLANWLKQHQASASIQQDSIAYTRAVMRLMKIVTFVPLVTGTPVVILSAGQMFLPELPMWLNRLLVMPYFLSSAANPWLTIGLVGTYRRRFKQLIFRIKKPVSVDATLMRHIQSPRSSIMVGTSMRLN